MDTVRGRVIVDSGASSSMAGLEWLEDVQTRLMDEYGHDWMEVDASYATMLTFANGETSTSLGKITVPMFLGGVSGKLKFVGVDKPGPALLGMDYMQHMGWCVDFETGRCVIKELKQDFVLPRLPNGHLYVDIFDHSRIGAVSASATVQAVALPLGDLVKDKE